MSESDGLTRRIAALSSATRWADMPDDVRRLSRQALLDFLGVSLAGSAEPLAQALSAEMECMGGAAASSVLGRGIRLPAPNAALVNGAAAHAHDYDDANMSFGGHTSAVLFPTVLALGEELGSSGEDTMTAYLAGYQAAAAIGALVMPSSLEMGFHLTGTVGVFGAAAAAAHLMQLNAATTSQAFGIAAAQAAGLRADGGTMCKPLHAGKAAHSGMLAALLARRGFTGRTDILECASGFIQLYSRQGPMSAAVDPTRHYLRENIFKFHAACFFIHGGIACAHRLRADHDIRLGDVARIDVTVHPKTLRACAHLDPADGLQSKRSFPFGVAAVFAGLDTADLRSFSDAAVQRDDVRQWRELVRMHEDARLPETAARVDIAARDGASYSTTCDALQIRVPDLDIALESKFDLLAAPVLGADAAERLKGMAKDVFALRNIRDLIAAASPLGFVKPRCRQPRSAYPA